MLTIGTTSGRLTVGQCSRRMEERRGLAKVQGTTSPSSYQI